MQSSLNGDLLADSPDPELKVRGMDPRSARVRESLFAAAELLGESGESFSVSALVRSAGVSRSVFYVHFADLADFVLQLQRGRFAEIAATAASEREGNPHEAMLDSQRRLVAHFAANRQLYRAAFANAGHRGVAEGTSAAIADALRTHLETLRAIPAAIQADLVASYVAHAATGLLSDWLLDVYVADEETVAQHLFSLMPRWLHEDPDSAA